MTIPSILSTRQGGIGRVQVEHDAAVEADVTITTFIGPSVQLAERSPSMILTMALGVIGEINLNRTSGHNPIVQHASIC